MSDLPLKGLGILVVEDQYLVAIELRRVLERYGASVVGPVGRLPLDSCTADRPIDVALLDVALPGGTALALADALPPPYRQLLRLDKPIEPIRLRAAMLQLTGRQQGPAA